MSFNFMIILSEIINFIQDVATAFLILELRTLAQHLKPHSPQAFSKHINQKRLKIRQSCQMQQCFKFSTFSNTMSSSVTTSHSTLDMVVRYWKFFFMFSPGSSSFHNLGSLRIPHFCVSYSS